MNESAYWDLHHAGAAALHEARFAEAETALAQALAEAHRLGDRTLVERARCNRAAAQIVRGTAAGVEEDLSGILGTSPDAKTRQLAAYNLATFHSMANRTRISRFYANMSLDLARRLRDRFSHGVSAYQLGLLEIEEGRPGRSLDRLREALAVGLGETAPGERMLALSLLGYVLTLTGNRCGAVEALEASEKPLGGAPQPEREPGLPMYEPLVRLNLGFSYLEIGELERALQNGRKALGSLDGQPSTDPQHRKHALYLLGETQAQRGEIEEAREHFRELQRTYYPQLPDLTDLLLSIRTHGFLSWMRL